jgi:Ca2+-binding RTX toxin-like protein
VKIRVFAFSLIVLLVISAMSAFAAGISVPASNVGEKFVPVTVNDVKPSACDSLSLTNLISGSGILTGTSANDLIIGSEGIDIIDGAGGNDCILSRAGDDIITGNDGFDICLGGSGADIFVTCESENQ